MIKITEEERLALMDKLLRQMSMELRTKNLLLQANQLQALWLKAKDEFSALSVEVLKKYAEAHPNKVLEFDDELNIRVKGE